MPSFNFRFYMHIWTVSSNLSNTSLSLFQSFSHLHHILPFSARLFEPLPQGRPGLLWVAPLSAVGHLNAVTYIRSNEGKPSSMNSHRIDCESSSRFLLSVFGPLQSSQEAPAAFWACQKHRQPWVVHRAVLLTCLWKDPQWNIAVTPQSHALWHRAGEPQHEVNDWQSQRSIGTRRCNAKSWYLVIIHDPWTQFAHICAEYYT